MRVVGICQIAFRRGEKAKKSGAKDGGSDPPSFRNHPPTDLFFTARAPKPNFIAFLDSLGPYDHFDANFRF